MANNWKRYEIRLRYESERDIAIQDLPVSYSFITKVDVTKEELLSEIRERVTYQHNERIIAIIYNELGSNIYSSLPRQ
jgi:hypothetical protein